MQPINIHEYQLAARERLSQMAYDYYAGGAYDEVTLKDNRAAFDRLRLYHRVLKDIRSRDLSVEVLGQKLSMPIYVAPTAFHGLAHEDGELATASAAGRCGTLFTLSTLATRSIEEVTAATDGPVWFQLYVYKDRGATRSLVERAAAAGCKAIALTVDAQVWSQRECDVRNGFHLPDGLEVKNLHGDKAHIPPEAMQSGLGAYVESLFDTSLSWQDLEWLCGISELPVVVKGVVHPEDARLAVEHGAKAVVVSNHGGRQLDVSPASLDALPAVVDAVGDRIDVLVDGGIRRGSDALIALALGAKAVAVGRPALWGLAVNGSEGVEHVLDILRDELDRSLALCGCTSIQEVGRDLVFEPYRF